jgi:hypothetical protein
MRQLPSPYTEGCHVDPPANRPRAERVDFARVVHQRSSGLFAARLNPERLIHSSRPAVG